MLLRMGTIYEHKWITRQQSCCCDCCFAKEFLLSKILCLKAVDTIGNCQRLAFKVGVSQHMHKITNL